MRKAGSFNKSVRFYPSEWYAAQEGLSRLERSVLFELVLFNLEKRIPMPVQDFGMAVSDVPSKQVNIIFNKLLEMDLVVLDGEGFTACVVDDMKFHTARSRLDKAAWAVTRLRIFERDGFTCRYCGERPRALECDHVIPVSRGGLHEDDNLVTACKTCNRKKSDRTPEEMRWTL